MSRKKTGSAIDFDAAPQDREPVTWRSDLGRMRGGEVDFWFIHASRAWLLERGYIHFLTDPETGKWVGDQITPAGLEALRP